MADQKPEEILFLDDLDWLNVPEKVLWTIEETLRQKCPVLTKSECALGAELSVIFSAGCKMGAGDEPRFRQLMTAFASTMSALIEAGLQRESLRDMENAHKYN